MSLLVYTGLPASGKTKAIITALEERKQQGEKVLLFISAEHEELTNRPNVRDQGLMGCRDQAKSFPIDHVVDTKTAVRLMADLTEDYTVAFDEAQYFQPSIVDSWQSASERGIDVIVGTPSQVQLGLLESTPHERVELTVNCSCGKATAVHPVYEDDLVYPKHLCDTCYGLNVKTEVESLLATVHQSEPFPNENHTYQPFFGIDMSEWDLVREDCAARLGVILDAVNRCEAVVAKLDDAVNQPTYIDLGCCSGFFTDGMTGKGFRSAGVDVSKDFVSWASQLAHIKGQAINYTQRDLLSFLNETDKHYDVISTFATVQWVMAQKGYEAGLSCFGQIFARTDAICIVEMGYTTEEVYRNKITDRPVEIDRTWMMNLMQSSGAFHTIELHPAGESGIWRDIFVGFKAALSAPRTFDDFPVRGARQTSRIDNYWQDGWVGPYLLVNLRAQSSANVIQLEGWRPDGSPNCELHFSAGNNNYKTVVESGLFTLSIPVNLNEGDYFEFSIRSSKSFRPDDDARQLAFILRNIAFAQS